MPKVNLRRIKSAPKSASVAVLLTVAVVLTSVLLFGRNHTATPYTLHLKNTAYHLEAAATEADQQKGLGDRAGMPADHGMVFIFAKQAEHCFWMKDMRFNLDIIWADSAKRVVAIERNLAPSTYPRDYCHIGEYVVELPAGAATANRLSPDQQLHF